MFEFRLKKPNQAQTGYRATIRIWHIKHIPFMASFKSPTQRARNMPKLESQENDGYDEDVFDDEEYEDDEF